MPQFRLNEILKEKRMTITELSKLTGISRNSISLLAHGHSNGIQFNTLYKISEALDISIGEIFEQKRYEKIYLKAKKLDQIIKLLEEK